MESNGAEDWNRTSDTSIFSAVLYRLSYLGTRKSIGRTLIITSPVPARQRAGLTSSPAGILSRLRLRAR